MRIKTGTYHTPIKQRKLVDSAVDEMMQAGILERSNKLWRYQIVLVKKKDGSKRFCVKHSIKSQKIRSTLPVIDDTLTSLGSAKYFSS